MKKRRRKLHHRAKHFWLPHRGNAYVPGLFTKESVAVIAVVLFFVQLAYIVHVKVVLKMDGFTAAVLPSALTSLANADREAHLLTRLKEDALLARAAQAKADDMASRGYFAHVSPDGRTFRQHLDDVGYAYSYAGENLAVDFEESVDVERAWMNSPTHRANILKSEYTHVGYGVARGVYQGREVTFVAQFFAAKRGEAPAAAAASAGELREVPAGEPAVIAAERSAERVLGEAAAPVASAGNSVAVLATSPSKTVSLMLMAFTALVAVLYAATVLFHIRNKYLHLEMLMGGVIILAIGLALLYVNAGSGDVALPLDGVAALPSGIMHV